MNKKGITLIALAITLLVMIILTSTSIYFGFRALNKSSNFKIYSNLSLLYPKIVEIVEKYNFNPLETDLPGYELTQEMKDKLNSLGLLDANPLWRFLTENDLDNMNLPRSIKAAGTNIFVNYENNEIIYTNGYKKPDGTVEYRYSEMRKLERMSEDD